MQSSESKYGKNKEITDSEESIDSGVQYLAEMIKKSETKNCDIWTAVQAYNFGPGYIDYIEKNGGKHSLELAERYSKNVLSPLLGNKTSEKYKYWQPVAIYHNGGYLYRDGGNFFYANIVNMNQKILKYVP